MSRLRDGGNIDNLQVGICRRFDPNESWLVISDRCEGRFVGEVEVSDLDSELREDLSKKPKGAAVNVLLSDDDIATALGRNHRRDR